MNKQGELGRVIIYSIISAVIFLLIYSWWFGYPSQSERIIDEGKEILNKIENKLTSNNFNLSRQESRGQISCKADLDEQIRIGKIKAGSNDDVKLIEIKTFQDIEDAVEHIKKWQGRIIQQEPTINNLRKRYERGEYEGKDIPLMIIRQKACVTSLLECYYQIIIATCDGDKHLVLG